MKDVLILIPALNPPDRLLEYTRTLIKRGYTSILIVNDGSTRQYQSIFRELDQYKECTVLHHGVNLGKGRALKSGINYFLTRLETRDYCGIITVDSDGQHSIDDVEKMHAALDEHTDSLILGCRDFSLAQVPFKSRFGNKLTRRVFHALYGLRLTDTQTGLRGLPVCALTQFIQLDGERFEYETGMLITAARKNITIVEVPVQTIYFNDNAETHFDPVRDSIAIYHHLFRLFFRYTTASLASSAIDLGIFQIVILLCRFMPSGSRILTATIAARALSSLANFSFNKNLVFCTSGPLARTAARYYLLVAAQMLASGGLVAVLYQLLSVPELYLKLPVDTLLFFISFQIQKNFIFTRPVR